MLPKTLRSLKSGKSSVQQASKYLAQNSKHNYGVLIVRFSWTSFVREGFEK
ncbi:MAG: hypothetical protein ACXWRZ_18985 [Bdellovibrio sp.]